MLYEYRREGREGGREMKEKEKEREEKEKEKEKEKKRKEKKKRTGKEKKKEKREREREIGPGLEARPCPLLLTQGRTDFWIHYPASLAVTPTLPCTQL